MGQYSTDVNLGDICPGNICRGDIFVNISNISAVADLIMTQHFGPDFLRALKYLDQTSFDPNILLDQKSFWTNIFLFRFVYPKFAVPIIFLQSFFGTLLFGFKSFGPNFFGPKISGLI